MIKRYVKKPIPIEAIQWQVHLGSQMQLEEFVKDPFSIRFGADIMDCDYAYITTLQGQFKVKPGDYIIKGVRGQFYSCDKDIFQESYDEV